MSGGIRMDNRQGAMRNRFVNSNKNGMGPGPGVKHMNNSNSNGNRDSVIRRNIEHMKMVAQKKRVAQDMYYNAGRSPLNLQKKKQRFQNMNGIKTVSSTGKVVYLQHVRRPANYTVRVENDRKSNYKHHVAKDLNPQLQQEIKLIQNKNMRQIITAPPIPAPMPQQIDPNFEQIDRLPIVATSRTLHERFSMI
ncbi:hypothetical protein CBL_05948 [Carabus blaptoides fortunei]